MTPLPPLLRLSHVTLSYEEAPRTFACALNDISLEIYAGERLCILGANGSGKTTLASVLCGLLAPDEGSVQLLGEDVYAHGRIDLEAYKRARRGIGLVFQNPEDQIVTSIVADDVAFGPENLGVPAEEIRTRVARELHRVALEDYATADPRRLSGGQQQRLAIAGALAMEPRVLVFDEPGALLDVRGRRSILQVMNRLHTQGVSVIHITHYMEEALEADRVMVLDHGHIALAGTPTEVFSPKHTLANLGLEQPFAARLVSKLAERGRALRWTCDDTDLMDQLADRIQPAQLHRTAVPLQSTRGHADSSVAPKPRQGVSHGTCPMDAPSALEVSHASFSYQAPRHSSRLALNDVSFTVSPGDSVALIGQTGSGKSTLLRLMCALEVPDAGHIIIRGMDTAGGGRGRRARAWRAQLRCHIGFVMQRPERQLFAENVEQDVAFGPTNQGLSSAEIARRVDHALTLCGLCDLRTASPFELSGGQQRLCAIAGVLAMQPEILVLDEPTAGLDPQGRTQLRALLKDLNSHGVTIIQVTHSMEEAARTDRVVVLDQSRLLTLGTPAEVFSRDHAKLLSTHGLGLPRSLTWTQRLEEAGIIAPGTIGNPLTTEELVAALVHVMGEAHGV